MHNFLDRAAVRAECDWSDWLCRCARERAAVQQRNWKSTSISKCVRLGLTWECKENVKDATESRSVRGLWAVRNVPRNRHKICRRSLKSPWSLSQYFRLVKLVCFLHWRSIWSAIPCCSNCAFGHVETARIVSFRDVVFDFISPSHPAHQLSSR